MVDREGVRIMSNLLVTKREWSARIVAECILAGGLDDMLDEIIEWEFNQAIPYIVPGMVPPLSIVGNS